MRSAADITQWRREISSAPMIIAKLGIDDHGLSISVIAAHAKTLPPKSDRVD